MRAKRKDHEIVSEVTDSLFILGNTAHISSNDLNKARLKKKIRQGIEELESLNLGDSLMLKMILASIENNLSEFDRFYKTAKSYISNRYALDANYLISLVFFENPISNHRVLFDFIEEYPDQKNVYRLVSSYLSVRGYLRESLSVCERALKLSDRELERQYSVIKNIYNFYHEMNVSESDLEDFYQDIFRYLVLNGVSNSSSEMYVISQGNETIVSYVIKTERGFSEDLLLKLNDGLMETLLNKDSVLEPLLLTSIRIV